MIDPLRLQLHIGMTTSSRTTILFLVRFISITPLLLFPTTTEAQPSLYSLCSYGDGNFTTKSTYRANLNVLLSSLTSMTTTTLISGFATNITGEIPDRVYGLAFCRGDLTPADCGNCLKAAASDIQQICPFAKSAMSWYDDCFVRYSNRWFLGNMDSKQQVYMWNSNNITTGAYEFNSSVLMALKVLADYASDADSRFAAGQMRLGKNVQFPKLYCLVQCTRDVSANDCNRCLQDIIDAFPSCCSGKIGGRILTPSCYFRFEVRPFWNWSNPIDLPEITPPPPLLPSPPSVLVPRTNNTSNTTLNIPGSKKRNNTLIISVSVGFGALVILCAFIFHKRGKLWKTIKPPIKLYRKYITTDEASTYDVTKHIDHLDMVSFEFGVILRATNDFSDETKLGEGGFRSVYKGTLLGGKQVAVKRLSCASRQGTNEFRNEVVLISKLQHRNLVQLLGCCTDEDEKILIYEFMPNKSLDHFLFGSSSGVFLDWSKRFNIIQGIAQGLLYLHRDSRLRIIHRDLKASNILLDSSMNPKISDFGLARIIGDQIMDRTHKVVGTFGYMSPEYAMQGEFSEKSDVFSYGVTLLEVVSGKRITGFFFDEECLNLIGYAWKFWNEDNIKDLIEPLLFESLLAQTQITKCINIALLCVQEFPKDRPNMSGVVSMLTNDVSTIPIPKEPAFIGRRDFPSDNLHGSHGSSSSNGVTITELLCR